MLNVSLFITLFQKLLIKKKKISNQCFQILYHNCTVVNYTVLTQQRNDKSVKVSISELKLNITICIMRCISLSPLPK